MNLSIQNHHMMNKNTTYRFIQKTAFKGKYLTSDAFSREFEIIEKIKSLPNNVFEEKSEFVKFCKSISITPNIYGAIKKRLSEVRQVKLGSDNAIKCFIESRKRIIEGYKWILNNSRALLKNEIAEVTEISLDTKLPQDIRKSADELLKKNAKIKLGLY